MDRLDKIIASQTEYTRKDVKNLIEKSRIKVNDIIVFKSDMKINAESDIIKIDEKIIEVKKNVYLILNKPKGYVSATVDEKDKTDAEDKIKDLKEALEKDDTDDIKKKTESLNEVAMKLATKVYEEAAKNKENTDNND